MTRLSAPRRARRDTSRQGDASVQRVWMHKLLKGSPSAAHACYPVALLHSPGTATLATLPVVLKATAAVTRPTSARRRSTEQRRSPTESSSPAERQELRAVQVCSAPP